MKPIKAYAVVWEDGEFFLDEFGHCIYKNKKGAKERSNSSNAFRLRQTKVVCVEIKEVK